MKRGSTNMIGRYLWQQGGNQSRHTIIFSLGDWKGQILNDGHLINSLRKMWSGVVWRERTRQERFKIKVGRGFVFVWHFPMRSETLWLRISASLSSVIVHYKAVKERLAAKMCLTEKVRFWKLEPSQILFVLKRFLHFFFNDQRWFLEPFLDKNAPFTVIQVPEEPFRMLIIRVIIKAASLKTVKLLLTREL